MKKHILGVILLLIFTTISIITISNNYYRGDKKTSKLLGIDTTVTNPKVDIKVNKEYDKNGNIIRYDSSYTYIYTYPDGSLEMLNIDSIFNNFRPYFFNRGFDLMQKPFIDFFDVDSSFQKHFFDNDYFMQQFEQEMFHFEELMHEMDSLRNLYLKEMYPDLKQELTPGTKKTSKTIEI
ncbi:MAG: hypothetical protein A2W99_12335 [Bacteroidetes bacterium GWF2_33_16]|nr:MAG: hypothetical protein A2X00_01940 [Bacteroidetes bacterium GWE2_32_14]OFY06481.1 MAG: hypothetical protein A2W99_12335 [Bacteroidetes bacterium GWF2_33_16]